MNRPVNTPWGAFLATASASGITRLHFPGEHPPRQHESPPDNSEENADAKRWLTLLDAELNEYLNGKRRSFSVPVDLSFPAPQSPEDGRAPATPFRLLVWEAMRRIPYGQTTTYGELAARIGSPKAVRAVGGACGANPVPVIIPCHRVVAAGGIGGFSGDLNLKRALLELEKNTR